MAAETASATITNQPLAGGVFQYKIALRDTGTTNIGTFWFSWIPGEDFMSTSPTGVLTPANWTDNITHGGSSDGYAIEFLNSSGPLTPGNTLTGFQFNSTMTPAQMAGNSVFFPTTPVTTSFVYSGAPFSDSGFRFTAAPPAPTAWTGASSTSWADSGNWSGAAPGATMGTANTDTALFNQNAPRSPSTIDAGRNVQNITFDTASVNSLTIGTIGGQPLLLTASGTTQTTSTVVNAQTINAPMVLEGGYTFTSGASSSSATLKFGGGITPGSTTGTTTLTLNGSNAGANTISGVLADNGASRLAIAKSGAGVWILSGANTYSGGTTVSAGTLRFNITSGAATIAAGVTATVASGATLELSGSVSALGTAGGNRVHIINSSAAPGVLVSGIHQVVGGIDGAGDLHVNAGSDLTANHIIQNALTIGGTAVNSATVTIDASDSNGNSLANGLSLAGSLAPNGPFGSGVSSSSLIGDPANVGSSAAASALGSSSPAAAVTAVPEPSSLVLLALGGLALGGGTVLRRRARKTYRPLRFGS